MKPSAIFILVVLIALLSPGCATADMAQLTAGATIPADSADIATAAPATAAPASAAAATVAAEPSATPSSAPTPAPTLSPDMIAAYNAKAAAYFSQVGFADVRGTPGITRWERALKVQLVGKPNQADLMHIDRLLEALKSVKNLPPLSLADKGGDIIVYFLPVSKAKTVTAEYSGGMSFGSNGFYPKMATHPMRSGKAFIADELKDQDGRNGKLTSFFLLSLGLQTDVKHQYPDSALNFKALSAAPSDLDLLMLRLLYDPSIKPENKKETIMTQVKKLLAQWNAGE